LYYLCSNHHGYFLAYKSENFWYLLRKDLTYSLLAERQSKVLQNSCEMLSEAEYFANADEAIKFFTERFGTVLCIQPDLLYEIICKRKIIDYKGAGWYDVNIGKKIDYPKSYEHQDGFYGDLDSFLVCF
jgi:hypothetical protein